MSGYVYLIQMDGTEYYKVGISSKDVSRRLDDLQTGNPIKLTLVAAYEQDEPIMVERAIHKALTTSRILGEWFRGGDVVKAFIEYNNMAQADRMLASLDEYEPDEEATEERWCGESVPDSEVLRLLAAGMSRNKICDRMRRGSRQAKLARIRQVAGETE